jgi:hypothetical protein
MSVAATTRMTFTESVDPQALHGLFSSLGGLPGITGTRET